MLKLLIHNGFCHWHNGWMHICRNHTCAQSGKQNLYYAQELSAARRKEFQKTQNVFADQYTGINSGHHLLSDDLPFYSERVQL